MFVIRKNDKRTGFLNLKYGIDNGMKLQRNNQTALFGGRAQNDDHSMLVAISRKMTKIDGEPALVGFRYFEHK